MTCDPKILKDGRRPPASPHGVDYACGLIYGRCQCGCGEYKILMLNARGELFAAASINIAAAEHLANVTLAEVDEARTAFEHRGICGHA